MQILLLGGVRGLLEEHLDFEALRALMKTGKTALSQQL